MGATWPCRFATLATKRAKSSHEDWLRHSRRTDNTHASASNSRKERHHTGTYHSGSPSDKILVKQFQELFRGSIIVPNSTDRCHLWGKYQYHISTPPLFLLFHSFSLINGRQVARPQKVDLASDDGGILISKLGHLGKWSEHGGPLSGRNEQPERTY